MNILMLILPRNGTIHPVILECCFEDNNRLCEWEWEWECECEWECEWWVDLDCSCSSFSFSFKDDAIVWATCPGNPLEVYADWAHRKLFQVKISFGNNKGWSVCMIGNTLYKIKYILHYKK